MNYHPQRRPVYSAPYWAEPKACESEMNEITKIFELEVIKPVQAQWELIVVFDPKKYDRLQFGDDYRKLNCVSVCHWYPAQPIDECIGLLRDTTIFSTSDTYRHYWKVDIVKRDSENPALASHNWLILFIRMLFGLNNVPGTLQLAMDVIPSTIYWQSGPVYMY